MIRETNKSYSNKQSLDFPNISIKNSSSPDLYKKYQRSNSEKRKKKITFIESAKSSYNNLNTRSNIFLKKATLDSRNSRSSRTNISPTKPVKPVLKAMSFTSRRVSYLSKEKVFMSSNTIKKMVSFKTPKEEIKLVPSVFKQIDEALAKEEENDHKEMVRCSCACNIF